MRLTGFLWLVFLIGVSAGETTTLSREEQTKVQSLVFDVQSLKWKSHLIHRLLIQRCGDLEIFSASRTLTKRSVNVSDISVRTELEIEARYYSHLLSLLKSCMSNKTDREINLLLSNSEYGGTTPTPIPEQCYAENTLNLTEEWRKDKEGNHIYGNGTSVACDSRHFSKSGRPWFRFTGDAGTQLLNTCPVVFSCGSHIGLWSDEQLPAEEGEEKEINVYGSWVTGCKHYILKVRATRCPGEDNFVFKYVDDMTSCNMAFCSMDAPANS